jgi:hypothetical protein
VRAEALQGAAGAAEPSKPAKLPTLSEYLASSTSNL